MLQLVNEGNFQIRPEDLKSITICAKKWSKAPKVMLIEFNNGEKWVLKKNDNIVMESFGSIYIKNNNIKIATNINLDEVKQIVIVSTRLTNKRLVEIIELTNGEVMVEPLSKGIITDKMDSEYILSELKHC